MLSNRGWLLVSWLTAVAAVALAVVLAWVGDMPAEAGWPSR